MLDEREVHRILDRACQVVSDVGWQTPVRRPQTPAHHLVRLGAQLVHDSCQPVRAAVLLVVTAAMLLPAPPDHGLMDSMS